MACIGAGSALAWALRHGEQVPGKDGGPILLCLELIIYVDDVVALCLLLSQQREGECAFLGTGQGRSAPQGGFLPGPSTVLHERRSGRSRWCRKGSGSVSVQKALWR